MTRSQRLQHQQRAVAPQRTAPRALFLIAGLGLALLRGAPAPAQTTVVNTATLTYVMGGIESTVYSNSATTAITDGYTITGYVHDENGQPVSGATVEASAATRAVTSATTDQNGYYELAGLAAGTYDLRITAPGRAAQVIEGVTIGAQQSSVALDVWAPSAPAWQAPLQLCAVPFTFDDPSPAAVFGSSADLQLARWVPEGTGGHYVFYGQDGGFPDIAPGVGFWMRVSGGAPTVAQVGTPPSADAPYAVPLAPGWNMVGNPFGANIEWAAVQVRRSGQTVPLETAASNNWVRPYAWAYDSASGEYVLVDAAYPGALRTLGVWQACWVRALTACELLLPAPGSVAQASAARSVPLSPEWSIQLIARAGELCDAFNFMGVAASGASDARANLQSPPRLSPYVDLAFSGGRAATAELATDFRPPAAGRVVWDFVVRCDVPNAQVVLTWPDLSQVPQRYRLMLVDLDAQRRQYMHTTSSYVFRTGPSPGERRFQVEVDPTPWARLQVAAIQQIPARASGMTISYDVSSPAAVDIEIRTLAGQLVKVLARGVAVSAGTNLITWDGTDYSSRMMPAGPYLCAISAVTDEGQAVKGMRTVILSR